jgi:Flp pilus assembly protein TadD
MGRSLVPIAEAPAAGGEDRGGGADAPPRFEAQGLQYAVEHRGGRVFHTETRRDDLGRIIARNEAEVQYVLGSGRQALAYLIDRDGFLFESPITWYVRKRRWDLSPGYEKHNVHFDRPIQPECLYCHANRVEPVEGTINRYERPVFRGHAIGCERCHGPGALHVARPQAVAGRDVTIVNPADLEPVLREAVCEQCHLLGDRRVVRAGRRNEDYRPGLPFHRYWSALVQPAGQSPSRFVGQVEQMHASRCYVASRGRLGCISCHDPHQLPAAAERVAFYRERCLECHGDRGCSLPADVRRTKRPGDDCAGCHMPRSSGSATNPHVATSDHRIPRLGNASDRRPAGAGGAPGDDRPLVNFHEAWMDAAERAEAERDLGVAICSEGPDAAEVAVPLLEGAVAARPDDLPARESLGYALGQLGRAEQGLAAFRAALARAPNRESALAGAAVLAAQAGRPAEAIASWRRAIAINPWRAHYRSELALQLFRRGDWRQAAEACREALRLNSADLAVQKLLIECELHLGEPRAARADFETLL